MALLLKKLPTPGIVVATPLMNAYEMTAKAEKKRPFANTPTWYGRHVQTARKNAKPVKHKIRTH